LVCRCPVSHNGSSQFMSSPLGPKLLFYLTLACCTLVACSTQVVQPSNGTVWRSCEDADVVIIAAQGKAESVTLHCLSNRSEYLVLGADVVFDDSGAAKVFVLQVPETLPDFNEPIATLQCVVAVTFSNEQAWSSQFEVRFTAEECDEPMGILDPANPYFVVAMLGGVFIGVTICIFYFLLFYYFRLKFCPVRGPRTTPSIQQRVTHRMEKMMPGRISNFDSKRKPDLAAASRRRDQSYGMRGGRELAAPPSLSSPAAPGGRPADGPTSPGISSTPGPPGAVRWNLSGETLDIRKEGLELDLGVGASRNTAAVPGTAFDAI